MRNYKNQNFDESTKVILIVEDDEEVRKLLEVFLRDSGYDTYSAENGIEALALLPKIPKPSLILLDLMMPAMNGWEFENEISKSEEFSKIPIIVLTASDAEVEACKCKDVIRKPINLGLLIPTLKLHFARGHFDTANDNEPVLLSTGG